MKTLFKYKFPERKYKFKITDCYNCPFCYDMISCMAYDDTEDTVRVKESIPENCPLEFVGEEEAKE